MAMKSEDPHISYIISVGKKSFIWFGMTVLLIVGFALLSYHYVDKAQTRMDVFVSKNAVLAGLFHQLTNDLRERQHLIEGISRENNYSQRRIYVAKYQAASSAVDNRINYLHTALLHQKEKNLIDAIQHFSKKSISLHQAVISHMNNSQNKQALISYFDSVPVYEKTVERLELLIFVERSNKKNMIDDIGLELDELVFYSVLTSITMLLLLIFFSCKILGFSITQKNRLAASNKALKIAHDNVEEAERVRIDFIANMSHEIRTPMTSIKGVLGILNSDMIENVPLEAKELCRMADGSADRLLALIIDMLDFSKVSAGDFELVYKVFDIENKLIEKVKSYEQKAIHKNLSFSLNFDDSLPKNIQSDAHCINQIMGQLLNNAIKFTNKGGIKVDVIYLNKKKMIKIAVIDTGIGIPENELSRVFEDFVQGDGSLTREQGGTGLGLALCKQLTTALGGNIGAEKNLFDSGSTFWFTVPTIDVR